MLTVDQVRTRRRQGRLEILALRGATRTRALELAAHYIRIAERSVGDTREAFDQACAAVSTGPRDRKLAAGLRKLVEDRCVFDARTDLDPAELRREVFEAAAHARRALGAGERLDRAEVFAGAAVTLDLSAADAEELLYADLRSAHRLVSFARTDAEELLDCYDLAQPQAALLRAVRVTVHVQCAAPVAYRRLFRKLKFLRLLHTVTPAGEGYRIDIEGPYNLFASSTKYGLQLALLLPALRACARWNLSAEVRWGKERSPLTLELEGAGDDHQGDEPQLPDELRVLLDRIRERTSPWEGRPSDEVWSVPGVGVCVPDVVFTHAETGARVYLEALGYWSRDAVWKRVELAERGLAQAILFAVPARLRVSEEVLGEDLPASLYSYKGVLHPAEIERRLDALAGRPWTSAYRAPRGS